MPTPIPDSSFSRRTLLTGTCAAIGSVAMGRGVLGQFDATPEAPVPSPPPVDPVADLAARLGYDREAIFAFVRDEIAYETYAGVLRGAKGTLLSRAGNSADQAILLGALLEASQIPFRFAVAPLTPDRTNALASSMPRTAETSLSAWESAYEAAILASAGLEEFPAAPPPLTPEQESIASRFEPSVRSSLDQAATATQTARTAISDALAAAGISLPAYANPPLAAAEARDHTWIQVADGPGWIDLDPTFLASAPADIPAATYETLPDTWHHLVTLTIAADELVGGSLVRRDVVTLNANAYRLVNTPVALTMTSSEDIAEVGVTINQAIGGQKLIFPSIYADDASVNAAQPLLFATDADSGLDALGATPAAAMGATEGEAIAVWLTATITSPEATPIRIERLLLDRLPPADRIAGTFDSARIAPVHTVATDVGDVTPDPFASLFILHTDVARIPPWAAMTQADSDKIFGATGLFGPTLAGLRDILGAVHETDSGFWSYPSAPNLTLFNLRAPLPDSNETTATIGVDILHRSRTVLPLVDAAPGTMHPLIESGILNAVAEQMLLLPDTRGDAGGDTYVTGPSVAGIFTAAATAGVEIRALVSAADLDGIDLDPVSAARIGKEIEAGRIVVIPVAPVGIGGETVLGWWVIDPVSGITFDQLQDGTGGGKAGFAATSNASFAPAVEDSLLKQAIIWIGSRSRAFICLGLGAMTGFIWAAALFKGLNGSNMYRMAAAGGLAGAGGAAGGKLFGCF